MDERLVRSMERIAERLRGIEILLAVIVVLIASLMVETAILRS